MIPDPAGLAAVNPSNPQTWNRYAYVGNNPVSFSDPSGLVSMPNVGDYMGGGGGDFNCQQDGIDQSCATVNLVLQGGGAAQCPPDNPACNPQYVNNEWRYFTGYADGSSGYVGFSQMGASAADLAGKPYAVVSLGRYCPSGICGTVSENYQAFTYLNQVVDYFGQGTIGSFLMWENLDPVEQYNAGTPTPSFWIQGPGGYFVDYNGVDSSGPPNAAYVGYQTFGAMANSVTYNFTAQIIQEWTIQNGLMTYNQETQVKP